MTVLFIPQIVTANSLLDGDTVYLNISFRWTANHRTACVARTEEVAQRLIARALGDASTVVEPRLIEVDFGDGGVPYPRDFRERARISGPSVGPVRLPA